MAMLIKFIYAWVLLGIIVMSLRIRYSNFEKNSEAMDKVRHVFSQAPTEWWPILALVAAFAFVTMFFWYCFTWPFYMIQKKLNRK